MSIKFTKKHIDFLALALKQNVRLLALEGTVRSSKTVIGIQAFFYKVYDSNAQIHLIAGRDFDTINNNILTNDMGLVTLFPQYCKLIKDKIGGYYVQMTTPKGIKKILLVGYTNKSKWTKILGLSIENIFVDEVNIADKQFIDECFVRQVSFDNPLTIWTLNGDVPTHWIYTEYINRCKILGYAPASIRADMDRVNKQEKWYYTFWNFTDNPVMTPEKIKETYTIYPVGSYYFTIKILGERGAPGKLIYIDYLSDKLFKKFDIKEWHSYGIGMDIGASRAKNTIVLKAFDALPTKTMVVDAWEFQQLGYEEKKKKLIAFCRMYAHLPIKYISIDSAEANFIRDLKSEFKNLGLPPVIESYKATIKDRIDMNIVLMSSVRTFFNSESEGAKRVYLAYSIAKWTEGKEGQEREDKNEWHNDMIDGDEYSMTRHMRKLMGKKEVSNKQWEE